ncbi:MAG TPA: mycothiol synthase [Pedococcus sp.]|nr:mycothiol synthase [Pedococcus sp.]
MASPFLTDRARLTPGDAEGIRTLERRARQTDGVGPLSEQAVLWLADASGRVRHHLAYAADVLVGYAQVADGDDGADGAEAAAELVVDPEHRRQGLGRRLADAVADHGPQTRLWAHGNLEAARALARSAGWVPVRELHKLGRALSSADTEPEASALPPGFVARAFVPGQDEQAWLEVNSASFAHHPEQGRLTLADLIEREHQPWFDPQGLILVETVETPRRVVAFHWTKVDPTQRSSMDPAQGAGEVYVVAVHPAYQGRGLGRPVTALGLAHLAGLGLPEVVLYVDADNTAAMRTYTGLGFGSMMVDVMYSHPTDSGLSG